MAKRGQPNGGPNVDEVTRDFAAMGVDDVGGMKFNEKTSPFKGDFCLPEPKKPIVLNSGGAGAPKKTGVCTPSTKKDERDDKNRGQRRKRAAKASLGENAEYLDDSKFPMATHSSKGPSPSTGNLLGSELGQPKVW